MAKKRSTVGPKLAKHLKDVHGYPYDDMDTVERQSLKQWHVHKHQDEAQIENEREDPE